MIAIIARVLIVRSRVFNVGNPIINDIEDSKYLIRIPEISPSFSAEKKPAMSDQEAMDFLMKKLKSLHGTKRVILVDFHRTDKQELIEAPIK